MQSVNLLELLAIESAIVALIVFSVGFNIANFWIEHQVVAEPGITSLSLTHRVSFSKLLSGGSVPEPIE